MTLQEAYQAFGGNYETALERLFSEQLMKKYLGMFAEDSTFPRLKDAFESAETFRADGKEAEAEQAYREAFENVHELKGVTLNLGIDRLAASSGALCESLRFGFTQEAPKLYQQVLRDYAEAVEIIQKISQPGA